MPRNIPEDLPAGIGATDIATIAGTAILVIVQPELGIPAAVAEVALIMQRGAMVIQLLQVVSLVFEVIDDFLSIILHLKELGVLPSSCDICGQLEKIANALIVVGEGDVEKSTAQVLEDLRKNLIWELPDGTKIPLGESLGRLLFTSVYHPLHEGP